MAVWKGEGTTMPKLKNEVPKLARSGSYACVYCGGQRHRLGIWGSPEAKTAYTRFIAELQTNPTACGGKQQQSGGQVLVAELAADFFKNIQGRMHPAHISHFKVTIGYLIEIYGDIAVGDFTPKKLKAVRNQMVRSGKLCRRMVNDYTGGIVRIFSWGVEEELVKADLVNDLREVKALRKGEPGTFENKSRKEVADDIVRRTLPFMSPTIRTMVVLQRMTGMRPSEMCAMTVGDIDKTRVAGLWHYVPKSQKTEEYIGERPIPLGKPEQILIAPYLEGKEPGAAVFSPRTAVKEIRERQRAERKTKVTPSQGERDRQRAKNPADHIGEFYDRNSYRKAVGHAIRQANKAGQKVPKWSPYQLRHAQATALEKEGKLDMAQAVLRHTTVNTTKRYAHGQLVLAEEAARIRVNPFTEDEGILSKK